MKELQPRHGKLDAAQCDLLDQLLVVAGSAVHFQTVGDPVYTAVQGQVGGAGRCL